jgi:hypothetical protein
MIIEAIVSGLLKPIFKIEIYMNNPFLVFIAIAVITLIILIVYWLIFDYLKKDRLTRTILSIIQEQRYYEGGVIDGKKVRADEEKVVQEIIKETGKPENRIRKMVEKYFKFST